MSPIYGVITGTVKDVDDPEGQGRIKVDFELFPGKRGSFWAPVAGVMAGNDRGGWIMPELGDEAVVAFDRGDVDYPYVLGFVWNGKDKPPSTTNKERVLKSKNGHAIRLLDSTPNGGNKGAVIIEDAHGNRIILTNGHVVIKSTSVLTIDAPTIVLKTLAGTRVVTPNTNPI